MATEVGLDHIKGAMGHRGWVDPPAPHPPTFQLVGVLVLAWAPSALFRLYYFRMYLGLILLGAAHGLAVLPAALSLWGWATEAEEEKGEDVVGSGSLGIEGTN